MTKFKLAVATNDSYKDTCGVEKGQTVVFAYSDRDRYWYALLPKFRSPNITWEPLAFPELDIDFTEISLGCMLKTEFEDVADFNSDNGYQPYVYTVEGVLGYSIGDIVLAKPNGDESNYLITHTKSAENGRIYIGCWNGYLEPLKQNLTTTDKPVEEIVVPETYKEKVRQVLDYYNADIDSYKTLDLLNEFKVTISGYVLNKDKKTIEDTTHQCLGDVFLDLVVNVEEVEQND